MTVADIAPQAKRRASALTLAVVAAVLGFVVVLEVAEGSNHRELGLIAAVCLWAVAVVIGVLHAPRWLRHIYKHYFHRR